MGAPTVADLVLFAIALVVCAWLEHHYGRG